MKLNRKRVVLGLATFGLAGAVATGVGVGVAQAGAGPAPDASTSATPPYGPGAGPRGMGGMLAGQPCLTGAASYLGLDESDLRAQLRAGKSLADVAKARGKSVPGLKDAMITALESRLAADSTLTAEEKTTRLEHLKSRIDAMVTATHGAGMGAGRMSGERMGGGWMGGRMHANR